MQASFCFFWEIVEQETAIHHIDFNTLGLLIGMMIIVGITAETGLFKYIAVVAAKKAKGEPVRILIAFALITAVGSAFLDNVTTVLLMVPVTLSITRQLRVTPIPFLITQIIASNVGGTATLIGDPTNIMIGSSRERTDVYGVYCEFGADCSRYYGYLCAVFTHQLLHLESATVALAGAFLLLLLVGEHQMEEAFARVE